LIPDTGSPREGAKRLKIEVSFPSPISFLIGAGASRIALLAQKTGCQKSLQANFES
jgi:hypothetical protein